MLIFPTSLRVFGTPDATYAKFARNIIRRSLHGKAVSQMIWAVWVCASDAGEMKICEGRMNSQRYISIRNQIRTIFRQEFLHRLKSSISYFSKTMSHSCHKSRITMK